MSSFARGKNRQGSTRIYFLQIKNAQGRSRTGTLLPTPDFESGTSTNFITWAFSIFNYQFSFFKWWNWCLFALPHKVAYSLSSSLGHFLYSIINFLSSNDEIGILYFYLGSQAPLLITWAFSIFNYQIRFWNKFRITYKEILAKTNYFSNSFFKSWFNSCGFALPFVSFIAWPTKNPNNLSFPDL